MNTNRIQYVAVVLTNGSRAKLDSVLRCHQDICGDWIGIPEYWTKYMHHMTVFYKKKGDVIPLQEMPPFGTVVELQPLALYKDDNCMCVLVLPDPDQDILKMPATQKPHITIACRHGIKPVYSNELMTKGIPFGFKEGIDCKLEGYLYAVGYDGTIFTPD